MIIDFNEAMAHWATLHLLPFTGCNCVGGFNIWADTFSLHSSDFLNPQGFFNIWERSLFKMIGQTGKKVLVLDKLKLEASWDQGCTKATTIFHRKQWDFISLFMKCFNKVYILNIVTRKLALFLASKIRSVFVSFTIHSWNFSRAANSNACLYSYSSNCGLLFSNKQAQY